LFYVHVTYVDTVYYDPTWYLLTRGVVSMLKKLTCYTVGTIGK